MKTCPISHIQAGIALECAFGDEYLRLDAHRARLIERDYMDAVTEDNLGAEVYARRIGKGNLAAYADVMIVRERKGWDT